MNMWTGETTLIEVKVGTGHKPRQTIGYLGKLVDIVIRDVNRASASVSTSLYGLDGVSGQINLVFGILELD